MNEEEKYADSIIEQGHHHILGVITNNNHDDTDQIAEERIRRSEVKKGLHVLGEFSDDDDEDDDDVSHSGMHNSSFDINYSDSAPHISDPESNLQSLYQLRVREIKRLTEDLKVSEINQNSLSKRLAISEAERENTQLSLQQCQELLANSNDGIADLENKVKNLNGKLALLEKHNNDLETELKTTTANLVDAQVRIQTSKNNKENVQTADSIIKAERERFQRTIDKLEGDLKKYQNESMDKSNRYMQLEKRYHELESLKDSILNEKDMKIERLSVEKSACQCQIKDLGNKLEATAAELVDYRTKCVQLQEDMLNLQSIMDQIVDIEGSDSLKELKSHNLFLRFSSHSDSHRLNLLHKVINSHKVNKEQMEKLNDIVSQKDKTIQILNDSEKMAKKEMDKLKEEYIKQTNELKILESKYHDLEKKYSNITTEHQRRKSIEKCSTSDLIAENNKLSYELNDAQKQVEEYKNMYIETRGLKDKLLFEVNKLKSNKNSSSENICNNEKTDNINEFDGIETHKIRLILQECIELQTTNTKLREQNDELNKKLLILTNEFDHTQNLIIRLNSEIELLKHKESLIDDLKDKAKEFEKLIMENKEKHSNRKSISTSTTTFDNNDNRENVKLQESNQHNGKPDAENNKEVPFDRKRIESFYNGKINELLEDFNEKLSEKESKYRKSLLQLSDLIKVKTKEMSALQEIIFAEKKKYQELEAQKNKISESLHDECKKELNECQIYIKKLMKDTEKDTKFEILQNKLSESETELEKLKDKYKTIKKTAAKYKEYVVEKDKHVESEIKRIKQNYEESMHRMQEKLDICISRKDQQINLKISEIEAQYAEKLKKMQNDIKSKNS